VTKDYVCGLEAVRIVCFGHACDGNMHVNVLKDELADDRWASLVPAVAEGIYRLALSLGGMITGEHGVGATRRRYLPRARDAVQIDVMRQIRAVFDPNGILNPGKIFPRRGQGDKETGGQGDRVTRVAFTGGGLAGQRSDGESDDARQHRSVDGMSGHSDRQTDSAK
jgi:hypothetical protein